MHVDHLHRKIFQAECWEFRPLYDNFCFVYFSKVKTVLFVPYALHDRDDYAAVANKAFNAMGKNSS